MQLKAHENSKERRQYDSLAQMIADAASYLAGAAEAKEVTPASNAAKLWEQAAQQMQLAVKNREEEIGGMDYSVDIDKLKESIKQAKASAQALAKQAAAAAKAERPRRK